MLYKYLFYGVSYYIKKYDNLWHLGKTYYIEGALSVGMAINTLLFNLYRLLGILWFPKLLDYEPNYWEQMWPFIIPLIITIYLGITKKHIQIYNEIVHLPPRKKYIYKILNIIHFFILYGGMFVISDYIRYYINGFDSPLFEWINHYLI